LRERKDCERIERTVEGKEGLYVKRIERAVELRERKA